jgi:glycosyltransferase involved in cell wall biosynthesis
LVGLSIKQIKQLSEYNNIIGLERTDSIEELVKLYSAADVFVNASLEESMGMTTVEAMACGTPAIVYNATALPEIISECRDYIVEPHDLNNLMRLIIGICSSEINPKKFRYAAMKYDENERYQDYLKLYKKIQR